MVHLIRVNTTTEASELVSLYVKEVVHLHYLILSSYYSFRYIFPSFITHAKVLTTATFRSSKLWCILKSASGLSTRPINKGNKTVVQHCSGVNIYLQHGSLVHLPAQA